MFNNKILLPAFISTLFAGASFAQNLSIRPKNFIVTPSTGPVCEIIVRNNSQELYAGSVTPGFMQDWRVTPLSQTIELKPGETKVLPFAIEFGSDLAANRYPVSVSADSGKEKTEIKAEVVCASTPYYKPEIDGKLDDWKDAIPVQFMTNGKSTVVRSYWNKNQFFLAVEVEEDQLIGIADASQEKGLDAIQFALSPQNGSSGNATNRHEFLAADSASMWSGDSCFQLFQTGQTKDNNEKKLKDLIMKDAEVKVSRSGNITTYEIAVPMKPMKNLLATAGREYCFNLLVHDPDDTGVRDLGSVMNLWNDQRSKESWSNWEFAKWNGYVPYDIGIEFGFCSSIH